MPTKKTSTKQDEDEPRSVGDWLRSWFCVHDYKPLEDLRGFFGITRCSKCKEYGRLPDGEMQTTILKFPQVTFTVPTKSKKK